MWVEPESCSRAASQALSGRLRGQVAEPTVQPLSLSGKRQGQGRWEELKVRQGQRPFPPAHCPQHRVQQREGQESLLPRHPVEEPQLPRSLGCLAFPGEGRPAAGTKAPYTPPVWKPAVPRHPLFSLWLCSLLHHSPACMASHSPLRDEGSFSILGLPSST